MVHTSQTGNLAEVLLDFRDKSYEQNIISDFHNSRTGLPFKNFLASHVRHMKFQGRQIGRKDKI